MKFKNLKLSKPEKLWLQAIYENGGIPDAKTFKVRLHGQIPEGFNYENVQRCFVWGGRLSLHGLWMVNPKDKLFGYVDKTIKAVRERIRKNPRSETVTAAEIAKETGIPLDRVREVFQYLGIQPGFWTSAHRLKGDFGQDSIGFGGDQHIDQYLGYKDIQALLDKTWEAMNLFAYLRPEELKDTAEGKAKLCYTKLCHTVSYGREKWSFHTNAAKVVKVFIRANKKGIQEMHINEIHENLPEELQSQSLSQIFKKRDKDAAWKKLIVDGSSGRGFYQLNPKYLENGLEEIDLSEIPEETTPKA